MSAKVDTHVSLPSVGEIIAERYKIVSGIARGSMGIVVLAEHLSLKRDVAIKFLAPTTASGETAFKRFQREALISKELNHPNIVQIFDFGEHNGFLYLVMEFLEGQELRDLMREAPQTTERVIDIGIQVLEGLAEAHSRSIIHRDLKPSNIFMTRDRRGRDIVKILDFGIAKALGEGNAEITMAGNVCGTPAYMAPEVYLEEEVGRSVDIYALGLILLEVLYGRRIVDSKTPARMMLKHLRMAVVMPERLANTPLGEVLANAIIKDRKKRYQDADQMLNALLLARENTPKFALSEREISDAFTAMLIDFRGDPRVSDILEEESEAQEDNVRRDDGKIDLGEDWVPVQRSGFGSSGSWSDQANLSSLVSPSSGSWNPQSADTWSESPSPGQPQREVPVPTLESEETLRSLISENRQSRSERTSDSLTSLPTANQPVAESHADLFLGAAAFLILAVLGVLYFLGVI